MNAESSNENARHRGVPDELEELRLYRERQRQDLAEEWEGRGGAGAGGAGGSGAGGQHRGGRRAREGGGGGRSGGGRGVERAAGMLGSRWFGWLLVGVLVAGVGVGAWIYVDTGGKDVSAGPGAGGRSAGGPSAGGTQGAGPQQLQHQAQARHLQASESASALASESASALAQGQGVELGRELTVLTGARSVEGLGIELTGCWQGGLTAQTNLRGKWTLLVAWRAAGEKPGSEAVLRKVRIETDPATGSGAAVLDPADGALYAPRGVAVESCQLVGAWQGWV